MTSWSHSPHTERADTDPATYAALVAAASPALRKVGKMSYKIVSHKTKARALKCLNMSLTINSTKH